MSEEFYCPQCHCKSDITVFYFPQQEKEYEKLSKIAAEECEKGKELQRCLENDYGMQSELKTSWLWINAREAHWNHKIQCPVCGYEVNFWKIKGT